MDSNEDLEASSSNNWETVEDLFEQVFGPDSKLSKNENKFDEKNTSSTLTRNAQTSYITLHTPDQGQYINIRQQAPYLTNEHTDHCQSSHPVEKADKYLDKIRIMR